MSDIVVSDLQQVQDAVQDAVAARLRLEPRAGGTKRHLGRAASYDAVLDVSAFAGIVDYQPEELVLTLRAGTPMKAVEAALAEARQILAFEPPDMTRILGEAAQGGGGTIGGVIAANLSGPRRLTAGAARDYLLGFEAVSGRGELFKSGGKVMKNVTGYDLSKLMCGSFGTLGVMDEITLKTLPAPETERSLLVGHDSLEDAISGVASIFATAHEPGAATILPQAVAAEEGVDLAMPFTAVIRLEGIEASVVDRLGHLLALSGGESLDADRSATLWHRIRDIQPLAEKQCDIWKVSCAPSDAPRVLAALDPGLDVRMIADWAGGLVWIAGRSPRIGPALRAAVADLGSGFAMLIRDVGATRESIAPFQPLPAPVLELHRRVKASFDPLGVLNYERMHEGV